MKVTKNKNIGFKPYELTISIENEQDEKLIRSICSLDHSISDLVAEDDAFNTPSIRVKVNNLLVDIYNQINSI